MNNIPTRECCPYHNDSCTDKEEICCNNCVLYRDLPEGYDYADHANHEYEPTLCQECKEWLDKQLTDTGKLQSSTDSAETYSTSKVKTDSAEQPNVLDLPEDEQAALYSRAADDSNKEQAELLSRWVSNLDTPKSRELESEQPELTEDNFGTPTPPQSSEGETDELEQIFRDLERHSNTHDDPEGLEDAHNWPAEHYLKPRIQALISRAVQQQAKFNCLCHPVHATKEEHDIEQGRRQQAREDDEAFQEAIGPKEPLGPDTDQFDIVENNKVVRNNLRATALKAWQTYRNGGGPTITHKEEK